jgi:hypothetical protein
MKDSKGIEEERKKNSSTLFRASPEAETQISALNAIIDAF